MQKSKNAQPPAVGCAEHGDPECLCDVVVSKPCPVVYGFDQVLFGQHACRRLKIDSPETSEDLARWAELVLGWYEKAGDLVSRGAGARRPAVLDIERRVARATERRIAGLYGFLKFAPASPPAPRSRAAAELLSWGEPVDKVEAALAAAPLAQPRNPKRRPHASSLRNGVYRGIALSDSKESVRMFFEGVSVKDIAKAPHEHRERQNLASWFKDLGLMFHYGRAADEVA